MITLEEFKEKSYIEIIQEYMKNNNGYITSKMVTSLGIHRMYLNIMIKRNLIEKIGKGIYMDISNIVDSYYVFSLENPKVIYSNMTALYLHGLSIKAPFNDYDISVPNKYHNSKINCHNVFYESDKNYNLGVIEVKTPCGNIVKAYDKEKCICDVIHHKNKLDIEHVKYSVRAYIRSNDKNISKLTNYAEKMGIKKEVMDFIGMMYE
jgi:hypothetical protein